MLKRVLCLAMLGNLLLSGCKPSQDSELSSEIVFRHALEGSPTSLDPAHASTVNAKFLAVNLYDTLYRYKYLARPYELTPNLATSMPEVSTDGRVYTIKIQADSFFHDDPAFTDNKGREVVAEDFVYSIKRQFDPETRAQGAWLWADQILGLKEWGQAGADYTQAVEGLRALDKYTLEITLINANPLFTHTLAQGFSAIVPKEAIMKWGPQFSSHPVGSGPFKLDVFNSAEAILVRNRNFRSEIFSMINEGGNPEKTPDLAMLEGKQLPLAERIELPFIKDETARWNALISGDVDSILAPSTLLGQILARNTEDSSELKLKPELQEHYHLLATREAGFVHFDFNMDDESIGYNSVPERNLANQALRCAIRKSYDWDARNRVFSQGTGLVFAGIIPPIVAEYNPDFSPESIQLDLPGAVELLKQHGWNADNLPTLTYGYAVSVTENQMFEQFRGFLINMGYPAEKIQARKFANFGDFLRAMNESDLNIIPSGWEMDYPDAVDTLQLFYSPNRTPGSNHANFSDPEFDRLFRQSRHLLPSPQRQKIFSRLNQIVIDSCVSITGLARTRMFIWNKRARVFPDRAFTGGYFLRFASVDAAPE